MRKFMGAFVALALVPSAAVAVDQREEIVLVVTAADLAGDEGQRAFQRRLDAATERFCGSYAARESALWPEIDDCRRSVSVSAGKQLARAKAGQLIRMAARSR